MLQLALSLLAAQAILLLLLRPLILWYFKINRAVKALESIDQSLKYLPAVQNQGRPPSSSSRRVA
jgi:hypothetical protein